MSELLGHAVTGRISDSGAAVVFRARDSGGRPVILKVLKEDPPSARGVAKLQREARICRELRARGIEGVPEPVEVMVTPSRAAYVMRDPGLVSLEERIAHRPLSLTEALRIGARVAAILAAIHQAGILHKDIKPANIVVDPRTLEPQLIDFGIAGPLDRRAPKPVAPRHLEGSLGYLAPEQTGRLGRGVDDRADLYALGVTLFELVAGRMLFDEDDPMTLVHRHITTPAPALASLRPSVPAPLSELVARLLRKNPEDRYQTARGVAHDLGELLRLHEEGKTLDDFVIGQRDRADRFRLPDRLYGRREETTALLEICEDAFAGTPQVFAIRGYPGIGKSRLVAEAHRPIARRGGWLARGTADPLRTNVPALPLVEAVEELTDLLMSAGEDDLRRDRELLADAVGPRAAVLVDLVPRLALLLGEQPEPEPLPPDAARARLQEAFIDLVQTLARSDHPLVLFLDDLQWADRATLELVRQLGSDPHGGPLVLVLAWRDNDPEALRPLEAMLQSLQRERLGAGLPPVVEQVLGDLTPEAVGALVTDATGREADDVAELAEVTHAKTHGNPLAVRQFLLAMHADGELRFDPDLGWTWAQEGRRDREVSANVVDLVLSRLERLEDATRGALAVAGIAGPAFALDRVAEVAGIGLSALALALRPAVEEGFCVAVDDAWSLLDPSGAVPDPSLVPRLRFVHDRVREAATRELTDDARSRLHLDVARAALAGRSASEAPRDVLVEVADHLVQALPALEERDAEEVAALLLAAGEAAVDASSFSTARTWFDAGRRLLGRRVWELPGLGVPLVRNAAVCTFLDGDRAAADALFDELLARSGDPVERARAANAKAELLTAQGDYDAAIDVGFLGLRDLGFSVPRRPTMARMLAALASMRWRLVGQTPEQIIDLPRLTDPKAAMALRILNTLTAPARFTDKVKLSTVVICTMCAISHRHGNAPESAFAWGQYGFLVGTLFGDLSTGARWSRVAGEIGAKQDALTCRPFVRFVRGALLQSWTEPPLEAAEQLRLGEADAAEAGNPAFQLNCQSVRSTLLLHGAPSLADAEASAEHGLAIARRQGIEVVGESQWAYRQFVRALMGKTDGPTDWNEPGFDYGAYEARNADTSFRITLTVNALYRALAHYLFDEMDAALRRTEEAEALAEEGMGVPFSQRLPWVCALVRLRSLQRSTVDRAKAKKIIAGHHKQLALWAKHAPAVHGHRSLSVEAGIALAERDPNRALDLYDRAVARAAEGGFAIELAVIHEEVARMHLASKRTAIAMGHLRAARQTWLDLGGVTKVRQLEAAYPELQVGHESGHLAFLPAPSLDSRTTTERRGSLDLFSVVKTMQALSSQLELADLVDRLLEIVAENAGARRAVLLRQDPAEGMQVIAERASDGMPVEGAARLAERRDFAHSMVRRAWRTGEAQRLLDTQDPGPFVADPWVGQGHARSILVVPLQHAGRRLGVLYLEHDESPRVFTDARQKLLELLSTQIGISLENADLYARTRAQAASFARFVPAGFLQLLGKRELLEVGPGDAVSRDMTVLFADIRSFVSRSEPMSAQETFRFVNRYLGYVGPVIRQHGGFIDKYIGDAVMALFPRHPLDALRAGVAMHEAVARFNVALAEEGAPPVRIGVGLHHGRLVLGTVGDSERLDGTVMSDVVNTASRLESLTKDFGAAIIASDAVVDRLPQGHGFRTRRLGEVTLRGRRERIEVVEVYDPLPDEVVARRDTTRDHLERSIESWRAGDLAAAKQELERARETDPEDLALHALEARLEHPPGAAG
jgi:predicted ATPase/class 3 adenylate cyclase